MKEVLVATDGSLGADRAIDFAAHLAAATQARLLILTVQEPVPAEVVAEMKAIEHVGSSEVAELTARGLLVRAMERAKAAGARDVHSELQIGDPAERILQVAARRKVDAVVVGKRGRGPLAALLLGSVSHKLVSLAPCGVIVVP
ncbi:MAG: universal stress protein [Alphaproteobacteria bacterium]|nr:universal stress protein [Alphaproteobacteria bacterium]